MVPEPFEVVGVYHANGGLLGKLAYATGKMLGLRSCSLCNISHGPFVEKASVAHWRFGLPYPFEWLHLNEIDDVTADAIKGHTPCVVKRTGDVVTILIDREELNDMNGDETRFFQHMASLLTPESGGHSSPSTSPLI